MEKGKTPVKGNSRVKGKASAKRKSVKPKRKKVSDIPDRAVWERIEFPCPSCSKPLKARQWKGKGYLSRIEVFTPRNGWIIIKQSGESV